MSYEYEQGRESYRNGRADYDLQDRLERCREPFASRDQEQFAMGYDDEARRSRQREEDHREEQEAEERRLANAARDAEYRRLIEEEEYLNMQSEPDTPPPDVEPEPFEADWDGRR